MELESETFLMELPFRFEMGTPSLRPDFNNNFNFIERSMNHSDYYDLTANDLTVVINNKILPFSDSFLI